MSCSTMALVVVSFNVNTGQDLARAENGWAINNYESLADTLTELPLVAFASIMLPSAEPLLTKGPVS